MVGTLLFLPIVLWLTPEWPGSPGLWASIALSALIRASYLASLGSAYARGDLSLVYPLARGIPPVLVPLLAVPLLGERPSAAGAFGILTVALGAYVLHLPGLTAPDLLAPFRALAAPHARFAALSGFFTVGYSVVDKWNMGRGVPPLLYAYLTIPVALLLLTPLALRRRQTAGREWRVHGPAVVLVAIMMTSGHLLVLYALQVSPVSYVAAARELGIVFGALLGGVVLAERHAPQRLVGASLIVLGVLLLAV